MTGISTKNWHIGNSGDGKFVLSRREELMGQEVLTEFEQYASINALLVGLNTHHAVEMLSVTSVIRTYEELLNELGVEICEVLDEQKGIKECE